MVRPPFPGHRRYSITHRAVQRLRELVPSRDDEDDESLRDRLDEALAAAEDSGKAIRTLDAMLGEPQTLVPVDTFGDVLYAIIKEDTVVTVLPEGHGQEILQRGQAMEQRVAAGQVPPPRGGTAETEERWDGGPRRRWRKDPHQPVVIQRIARNGPHAPAGRNGQGAPRLEPTRPEAVAVPVAPVVAHDEPTTKIEGPVAEALHDALELGRRRAAVAAISHLLRSTDRDSSLLPLWNDLAQQGVPSTLTIGDLIDAVRQVESAG